MGTFLKKYMWILTLLAVIVVSYLLAKMATLLIAEQFPDVMVSSTSSTGKSLSGDEDARGSADVAVILKRNFFDAEESQLTIEDDQPTTPSDDNKNDVPVDNQKAVKTSLRIQLVSTVSIGDGTNPLSSCVIQSGRDMDVYKIASDPSFSSGTKITKILPKRVEFLNNGRLEYVELVDFAKGMDPYKKADRSPLLDRSKRGGRKISPRGSDDAGTGEISQEGDRFQIPRAEVDKALSNINRLYTEIRAVPHYKDGKANGFKIMNVKRRSLFQKLGLKKGDILKSINGNVLDIQSGLRLFNELKNEESFELEIERAKQETTLYYDII